MGPGRRHRLLEIAVRRWRDAAQVFALLALLANAALLPGLHFAAGGLDAVVRSAAVAQGHHQHDAHDAGDGTEPASPAHQTCHFCRLLGVALPPPPSAAVERAIAADSVPWPALDALTRGHQHARAANLPRAPPLPV